jgi:hypothetical protein
MFFQSGHHQQEQTKKKKKSHFQVHGSKVLKLQPSQGQLCTGKRRAWPSMAEMNLQIRILLSPVLGVQDSFSCKVSIFKHAKTSAPLFSCTKHGTSQIHS